MKKQYKADYTKAVDSRVDAIMSVCRMKSALRNGRLPSMKRENIEKKINYLFSKSYTAVAPLFCEGYKTKEPVAFDEKTSGQYLGKLCIDSAWAENAFDCAWMHITGAMPSDSGNYVFLLDLGGEGLVFDKYGNPKQGITCYASEFEYSLGKPVKQVVLNRGLTEGNAVDFWVECGANDLFGNIKNSSKIQRLEIALVNENIRLLAYDLQVLMSVWDENKADGFTDKIYSEVDRILKNADTIDDEKAKAYREEIKPLLQTKNDSLQFCYSAIGHAHLDLAWKWPIRESKRKAIRTFTNQIMNIERYPDYIFGASQAQLYDWVKQDNPDIYNKVKELSKTPNWEVQGATWVEPDSNLISGESLVRQFFYGKQFFKAEFGMDMDTFWVPDSFGYSACIPQVMKLAGVKYFLTQKMSWNTVNKFPNHSFYWTGLDGSTVLAHMLPESTYNSPVRGDFLKFGERNYEERNISSEAMLLFGIGDGGGGPGFEHIERAKRLEDIKNMPKVKMEKSADFFKRFDNPKIPYPVYRGELYLERHQGTLTTQAMNKFFNRRCEILLRNYEILFVKANEKRIALPISKEELDEIWKEILLYQFHDILPGSSINRVYEESVARYKIIYNKLKDAIKTLLSKLLSGSAVVNFNSFNYKNFTVKYDGKWYCFDLPALSAVPVQNPVTDFSAKASDDTIENDCVKITFKNGYVTSLLDKNLNREFCTDNKSMGVFCQYKDIGDCWDIKPVNGYKFTRKTARCVAFKTGTDGSKAYAKMKYQVGDTTILQMVSIIDKSPLVTFDTQVDCHQKSSMLRVEFPTNIKSDICNFNVQFGHIARKTTNNNSVERAQFEASGQKFVDMSENDCGLSLINDGKYGFRCKNGVMDMNLIRSPLGGPGENVDQGIHHIRFALFPHQGELSESTYREAYIFNNPALILKKGKWIENAVNLFNSNNESFVLEAVKSAEDGSGFIARIYNSSANTAAGEVSFNGYKATEIVDIMENSIEEKTNGSLSLHGFELINIRFTEI